MIEQNGSDPMFEKEKEADDEDIIDLTDEVALALPAEGEEIIDLTDEVSGEEIIDLTDEVSSEPPAEDEEIIELTLEADAAEDDDTILEPADEGDSEPAPEDEEITELALEADGTDENDENLLSLLPDEPETTEETQPDLVLDDETQETEMAGAFEFQELTELDTEENMPQKDVDLAGAMGIQLDPARDLSLNPPGEGIEVEINGLGAKASDKTQTVVIPRELLETAIERTIESKLSDRIDRLLNAAIEKAVTTEINRLKRLLADDLTNE